MRCEGGGEGICCYFTCVALGMDHDFMFVALFRILKGLIMALFDSFPPHTHTHTHTVTFLWYF